MRRSDAKFVARSLLDRGVKEMTEDDARLEGRPLPGNSHPVSLEDQLERAQAGVAAARTLLTSCRESLMAIETKAKACWSRRKAALASRDVSFRAAQAAGVGKGACTSLS